MYNPYTNNYRNSDYGYANSSRGYGYGYSSYGQTSSGLFGRGRYDDYGGGGLFGRSRYGEGGGLFGGSRYGRGGLFGRSSYGGYGGGLFGRGGYGAYGGRRSLLSRIFGGVGLGIVAIGSLISGAAALHRHIQDRKVEKGKRSFGTLDLSMLWLQRSVAVKIPLILSLFYVEDDEDGMESKYSVKVGKAENISIKGQKVLEDLEGELRDGVSCCINFELDRESSRNKFVIEPLEGFDTKDEWEKLQAICERLAEYFSKAEEMLEDSRIRHQPLEYARLASTTLVAVLEQVGFMSATTVECKQDLEEEPYSWCVTDVALRRKNRDPIFVRVDLLHSAFVDDEEDAAAIGMSKAGVCYSYAAGGLDLFDNREIALGGGTFTGWDNVDDYLEELSKGMVPVTQAKKGKNGKYKKIPVITAAVTKYRNGRRVGARKEKREQAFAAEENTDVLFRNLLWYDTKSKPGKVIMKVLPFCLLVTYAEDEDGVDKDACPLKLGYNFLPIETEFVCSNVDIEQYAEEVEQGVSFPINFGIAQKAGKYVLRQKKLNGVTDEWERLQALVEKTSDILEDVAGGIGGWLESTTDESMSAFGSALLAAVLKLAGFLYVQPITVEKDWTVVDVALVRPNTKRTLIPKRMFEVHESMAQKQRAFKFFVDGKEGLFAQSCRDSVIVRVDMHSSPITYGYTEQAEKNGNGVLVVDQTRSGCEPFTGWENDLDYRMRRYAAGKKMKTSAQPKETVKPRVQKDTVTGVDTEESTLSDNVHEMHL